MEKEVKMKVRELFAFTFMLFVALVWALSPASAGWCVSAINSKICGVAYRSPALDSLSAMNHPRNCEFFTLVSIFSVVAVTIERCLDLRLRLRRRRRTPYWVITP